MGETYNRGVKEISDLLIHGWMGHTYPDFLERGDHGDAIILSTIASIINPLGAVVTILQYTQNQTLNSRYSYRRVSVRLVV